MRHLMRKHRPTDPLRRLSDGSLCHGLLFGFRVLKNKRVIFRGGSQRRPLTHTQLREAFYFSCGCECEHVNGRGLS